MKSKSVLAAGGFVLLIAAAAWFWFSSGRRPAVADEDAQGDVDRIQDVARRAKRSAAAANRPSAESTADESDSPSSAVEAVELSGEEQKLVDDIQEALDDEKLSDVLKLAAQADKSESPAVRQKIVEALQWFGEKAIPELLPFIVDADEDVRNQAIDALQSAISQIDDERAKVRQIETVLMVKGACTADGVTMLAGELNGISDEPLAVASVARIIEASQDSATVEAMKEVYQFITGDPYVSADAAEQWCAAKRAEAAE